MANVFTRTNKKVSKPKRNMFDLSRQNNLTMQMGYLYPVSVDEVLPGDSLRIQPTFGLRFMPLTFPVQTRMRANLHFFYVRTRNLWKDWPDFIGKTKEGLVPPYHNTASGEVFNNICKTGSLGDYLGVPTTTASKQPIVVDYPPNPTIYQEINSQYFYGYPVIPYVFSFQPISTGTKFDTALANSGFDITRLEISSGTVTYDGKPLTYTPFGSNPLYNNRFAPLCYYTGGASNTVTSAGPSVRVINFVNPISLAGEVSDYSGVQLFTVDVGTNSFTDSPYGCVIFHGLSGNYYCFTSVSAYRSAGSPNWYTYDFVSSFSGGTVKSVSAVMDEASPFFQDTFDTVVILGSLFTDATLSTSNEFNFSSAQTSFSIVDDGYVEPYIGNNVTSAYSSAFTSVAFFKAPTGGVVNGTLHFSEPYWKYNVSKSLISDITPNTSPYLSSLTTENSTQLKLSALPARAYEFIYNAFYRDDTNNPYVLDGVVEYNKWIPSDEGGIDNNVYTLRRRNWEADFLTTAKPSPQQGEAPLVGLTGTGMMTFQDDDGNTYRAQAVFAEDGETIQSFKVLDEGMPKGTLRSLVDYATQGISINDLRNVNALQRWLEKNIRRGLTYKDQIMSHYGVDVSYNILNMPEFIGGCSQDVSVNQINQMVERSNSGSFSDALGSYAGQAYCVGQGRPITHYFDEHGFVIGILSITPVPNYSQLLPKYFLKTDALDYFFPEFGHIGYQPIFNREVSPVQVFANHLAGSSGPDADMLGVFGYQRAWYEYLARVDEVHGLFRTNMRNFLVNRYFGSVPTLSPDFLLVDPQQVNDIFSVTDTTDKILGQIYLDVKAKRPIPMYGIPRLE